MPSRRVRDARLLSSFLLCKGTAKKFGKQETSKKVTFLTSVFSEK